MITYKFQLGDSSKFCGEVGQGLNPFLWNVDLLVLPEVKINFLEAGIRPGISHG